MFEALMSLFLGGWLTAAGILSYRYLKKEFGPWIGGNEKK